uniref:Cathelicidin 1 n=1 Tax=Myripristis murdjan TaxID=586833 RepID=A0A667ZJR4_9TELE
MKNQMRLFVLLALVALLVRAQTPAEPNYEDFLFNLKFPLDNYRPLLNQMQVETLPSKEVDRSALSVRSLTFPAQETECSSTQKQGSPCPLKENGVKMNVTCELMHLNFLNSHSLVRTRRSKSGRGGGSSSSGRGGSRGSRAGGGSSIAGGGNRNNGGTRTA